MHESRAQVETRLEAVAEEGLFLIGGQAYVEVAGEVVADLGFGHGFDGRSMSAHEMHNLYCASKPLLGLAMAHLADRGLLALDAPLADMLPLELRGGAVEGATPLSLLTHSVGLDKPTATEWRIMEPDRRDAVLPMMAMSRRHAYSEVLAGLVLEELTIHLTGSRLAEVIVSDVLDPLGVSDDFILDQDAACSEALADRVCVPIGGLPIERVPLLSELLPSQRAEVRPAFGALATMSALGRIYTALRLTLGGEQQPGMPSSASLDALLRQRGGPRWDEHLNRECEFAGGFMTSLNSTRICVPLSDAAIGHVAGVACCIGTCDPDRDVAIAVYGNGCLLSAEDLDFARTTLVREIIDSIEVLEPRCDT